MSFKACRSETVYGQRHLCLCCLQWGQEHCFAFKDFMGTEDKGKILASAYLLAHRLAAVKVWSLYV